MIILTCIKQPKINVNTFIYRFLKLPFTKRSFILTKFNLIDEVDESKNHMDILDKIIQNAKENGCLETVYEEIVKSQL